MTTDVTNEFPEQQLADAADLCRKGTSDNLCRIIDEQLQPEDLLSVAEILHMHGVSYIPEPSTRALHTDKVLLWCNYLNDALVRTRQTEFELYVASGGVLITQGKELDPRLAEFPPSDFFN